MSMSVLLALLTAFTAHADIPGAYDRLQAKVVEQFLAQANDPASAVGQVIAKQNEENSDGRNENGIIHLPLQASDLRVNLLEGEELYNPFHYGDYKDGRCVASGNSASFLIVLRAQQDVHGATEDLSFLFRGGASVQRSFPVKGKPRNCETAEPSDDGKISEEIVVSPFKLMQLQDAK